MPIKHLFIIYFIKFLLVALPGFGIVKLLKKANHPQPWKGYVPFLNTWEMQKLTGRPMHWVFWQLIPIVGWFITPGIFIEFVKLFGRYSFGDHTAATLAAPVYMPYIGNSNNVRYIGKEMVAKHKKGTAREWLDAAMFAVVAATLIRLFVFEAYVIPTGSMEKTLLVNDYLFVSKMSYGTRVPNTPLSFPFVHHSLPVVNTKSYVEWIKIPYIRWFANPVKRNDIVVFNFPANDTTTLPDDSQNPYYDKVLSVQRQLQEDYKTKGVNKNFDDLFGEARTYVIDNNKIVVRPVDKRENYVKRCVGIAGDTVQVINGILFINGKEAYKAPDAESEFLVKTSRAFGQSDFEDNGIKFYEGDYKPGSSTTESLLNISWNELEKIKKMKEFVSADIFIDTTFNEEVTERLGKQSWNKMIFPRNLACKWTEDMFGPLWIPKKGVQINLTPENIIKYKRAIETYEGNEFVQQGDKVLINGVPTTTYIFKMDYYWMMGDNRHNSQDSRYWGYVPEDHIVGKPKLIWMSWEKGPRWKRIFSIIQ
jgi:signal peptidase I